MTRPTYRVDDDRGITWDDGFSYAMACDDADQRAAARPGVSYSAVHQTTNRAEYTAYTAPAPAADLFTCIHE